jgi:hypothetical protein
MDSQDGKGIARRAWDRYASSVNRAAAPLMEGIAATAAADLLGFWLVWHLEGGFEGLRRRGMSRASIYRRIRAFRRVTGQHPDEFTLAGVKIDVRAHVAAGERSGRT